MTKDQDFKALVRARMAKTGESYATARANLQRHRDEVATSRATASASSLSCGRCGEPITDAEAYRLHLEQVHGRKQPTPVLTDEAMTKAQRRKLCVAFDEAVDVLEGALRECPDGLWEASLWHVPRTDPWVWPAPDTEPVAERTDESIQRLSAFWVVAYHCLWFLDFYTTVDPSEFQSPEYVRGGPEEMAWPADGAAPLPGPAFSRDVLVRYAAHGRQRVKTRITETPDDEFDARCPAGHPHAGETLRELLQTNLDHMREHGQQLADFVRASAE
jgi:DinB family protein